MRCSRLAGSIAGICKWPLWLNGNGCYLVEVAPVSVLLTTMKYFCLLTAVLLFSTCSSPMTNPTTKEASLIRVTEQLTLLSPIIEQASASTPVHVHYFVDKPETSRAQALKEATQILRESPDLVNELTETSLNMLTIGSKTDKAARIDQLKSALNTHPDLDLGWLWLASSQKDYAQAVTSISKAIALNDQVGFYYRRRALLHSLLHNYSSAVRDYQEALKLYADQTKIYEELTNSYAMMGDDQLFIETSDLYLISLRNKLSQVEKSRYAMGQESIKILREQIGYGHLNKAMYLISKQSNSPIICIDLAKAISYDVNDAISLQKKYCK